MKKYFFYGTVFFLFFTIRAFAQNPAPTPGKQTVTEANEENSDVVITANVRAKELKFEIVPTPTVTFPGNQPRQTVWEADRTNLPQTVEPGAVYRDIGIRLRIYSRFSEIQRIVIEALDETEPSNTTPAPARQTAPAPTDQTPAIKPKKN